MDSESKATAYAKYCGNSRSRRLAAVRQGFEAGWQAAIKYIEDENRLNKLTDAIYIKQEKDDDKE